MPETIQSFLDKIKESASILGDQAIIDLITAVRHQAEVAKLRILIVGSTGSGRFSLMNSLFFYPELFPISPVPKPPIGVKVTYSEIITVEALTKEGTKLAIPQERLRTFMLSPETDAAQYMGIELKIHHDLLRTSEFKIEDIGAKRSSSDWKELLAGTDYAILVLKAVALLSEQERRFIRDILNPNFGLERVAIIINQMDLVPEDERSSINELVRTFLGPFESQPMLIGFSAAQTVKSIESGNLPSDNGYETLMSLVKSDLVEKHSVLKSAAMRQAVEICLAEMIDGIARQNALFLTNEAGINELLGKFDLKNQWLQSRIQRSQRKIELFINTLIKEQFLREIEGFGNALRTQLPDEIMPIENISEIKRNLPGYMEAVWTEFFNRQMASVRSKLIEETKLISKMVEDDLKELFGDKVVDFEAFLTDFGLIPDNMKTFLMPRRNKNQTAAVATGLQLGGLLVLISNLPLGLASIGVGQIIRMINRKNVEASEKKAIVASAIEATYELER